MVHRLNKSWKNEDDAALFRAAVGDAKPLPAQNRADLSPPPRHPRFDGASSETIPDTLSDFGAESVPGEYLANGLSRMTLRKLRRTQAEDSLDLHGLDSDAARRLLQQFLHEALQRGLRCVLVIHGKGMNSPSGEAVLKLRARHWLVQHPAVLAWCDAPVQLGGGGAVLALLRSAPQDRRQG